MILYNLKVMELSKKLIQFSLYGKKVYYLQGLENTKNVHEKQIETFQCALHYRHFHSLFKNKQSILPLIVNKNRDSLKIVAGSLTPQLLDRLIKEFI